MQIIKAQFAAVGKILPLYKEDLKLTYFRSDLGKDEIILLLYGQSHSIYAIKIPILHWLLLGWEKPDVNQLLHMSIISFIISSQYHSMDLSVIFLKDLKWEVLVRKLAVCLIYISHIHTD